MLTVIYTELALANIQEIKGYLLYHFTQREVENLYKRLDDFENIVKTFPDLYPLLLNHKQIRRAVLSKQLSVFYAISENAISLVSILDNRMDTGRWPK